MSRFVKISVRKAWLACLVLLCFLAAGLYLLRKETYFLNKNVRLVSMRIFEFQELSLHRRLRYKMEFLRDRYKIYVLAPSPEATWQEVKEIQYEDAIETAGPGFVFEIDRGKVISHQWLDGQRIVRSPIILGFFPLRDPSKQAAILFSRDGTWRALQRYHGAT